MITCIVTQLLINDGITNASGVLINKINWLTTYERIVNEASIVYYSSKETFGNISYDCFQIFIWQTYNYILVFAKLLIENVLPVVLRFGGMIRRTKYKSHLMTGTFLLFLVPFVIIYMLSSRKRKEKALMQCFKELAALIARKDCHPIILRLAWSDAATYDQSIKSWPSCGGTTGSIRFDKEISIPSNSGLSKALQYLRPLHKKYHNYISWADLIQMAGALAVELCGGPILQSKMIYGRKDASVPKKQSSSSLSSMMLLSNSNSSSNNSLSSEMENSKSSMGNSSNINSNNNSFQQVVNTARVNPTKLIQNSSNTTNMNNTFINSNNTSTSECESSRLPVPEPPYPFSVPTAEAHIRHTFYRMGFKNKEIVALCGAHTIGRAFKDRSGVCAYASGDVNATMYTRQNWIAKAGSRSGIGMAGGCSWTKNWLHFDNSYFQRIHSLINNNNTSSNHAHHHHHSNSNNSSNSKINGGKNNEQSNSDPNNSSNESNNNNTNSGHHKEGELLWLSTDWALYNCSEFRPHFLRYANNQQAFFDDYADAHKKMSELGAKFDDHPIKLPFIDISQYINS